MKTLLLTFLVASNLLTITPSFAKATGNSSGGGGDASEIRVNDIRTDIVSWINRGGAKELNLPSDISYGAYVDNMLDILQPQKVVISFTEDKIFVNGKEKTCKGFIEEEAKKPNILCNISRFKNTTDPEQYRLVHHEYAGLASVEKNEEAASDYRISNQLNDFLEFKTILVLAVKPKMNSEIKLGEHYFLSIDGKSVWHDNVKIDSLSIDGETANLSYRVQWFPLINTTEKKVVDIENLYRKNGCSQNVCVGNEVKIKDESYLRRVVAVHPKNSSIITVIRASEFPGTHYDKYEIFQIKDVSDIFKN